MTFSQKLSSIIGLMALVAIAIAFFGINGAQSIKNNLDTLVDEDANRVALALRIQRNLIDMQRNEKNMIMAETDEAMNQFAKEFDENMNHVDKLREELRVIVSNENKAILDTFQQSYNNYIETFKTISKLTRENSNVKARALLNGDAKEKVIVIDKLTDELKNSITQDLNKTLDAKGKKQIEALITINLIETSLLKSVTDASRASSK